MFAPSPFYIGLLTLNTATALRLSNNQPHHLYCPHSIICRPRRQLLLLLQNPRSVPQQATRVSSKLSLHCAARSNARKEQRRESTTTHRSMEELFDMDGPLDTDEIESAISLQEAAKRGDLGASTQLDKFTAKLNVILEASDCHQRRFYLNLSYRDPASDSRMLDLRKLGICCPLDNGFYWRAETPGSSPPPFCAHLALPSELFQIITEELLDLSTLTLLRRVSRRFRQTIDELKRYEAVHAQAPDALRAAFSLEIASADFFTCKALYKSLCGTNCFLCGRFGGYLYLLRCLRVCAECFLERDECRPMTTEDVKFYWAITYRQMNAAAIPVVRSLPGN